MYKDAEIAARARACVGVRFRPYGRDPAFGLDCVGLVAFATGAPAPADYALRSGKAATAAAALRAAGLRPRGAGQASPGDILLLASAPTQLHLAVRTEAGFVHADAGLRRVVECPGAPAMPLLGTWRSGD